MVVVDIEFYVDNFVKYIRISLANHIINKNNNVDNLWIKCG